MERDISESSHPSFMELQLDTAMTEMTRQLITLDGAKVGLQSPTPQPKRRRKVAENNMHTEQI